MITPKLNILFYTSQLPRFFVPKGLWAKGVIWSTQQRKLSYVDITFFCSFCSRRAVFASLTGKLLGFPIWWLSCICVYGIVIFGRHILHILSMKNKSWQPIALTSPSCFVSCHKPSPWGKRVSGWCIARLRGKASRRRTEPGSLEQRGLQGRGPRDAGTKGEGGMRLGRLEQRQGLAETLCCLTAKRLARVLGKCMLNIVLSSILHPAAISATAPLRHVGSPARKACSPRHGGHHTDTPRIQQISSTSDLQTMDPYSHRRERVGSDTLQLQARVRGETLPVNCFCLMNCSFSLQQQIRAIKH